jgi:hypothetical protein
MGIPQDIAEIVGFLISDRAAWTTGGNFIVDGGWTVTLHPDDLNGLVAYWRSVLASGEPGEIEARLRRFDGLCRWFLFRATPAFDNHGRVVKWFGTNTDIEDRKRAEGLLGGENLVLEMTAKGNSLESHSRSPMPSCRTGRQRMLLQCHIDRSQGLVEQPADLPEIAQTPGQGLFLCQADDDEAYLYVEEQNGARLAVFDVTDPAKIKTATSVPVRTAGAFDFVRYLNDRTELVRFRKSMQFAVLDLHRLNQAQVSFFQLRFGRLHGGATSIPERSTVTAVFDLDLFMQSTSPDFSENWRCPRPSGAPSHPRLE